MTIVFIVSLSLAWCPKMSKLQMYTECSDDAKDGNTRRIPSAREEDSSRNRMSMITSTLKILFTILFAFGLNYLLGDSRNPGESLRNGFAHFNDDTTMMYEFGFQVCCTNYLFLFSLVFVSTVFSDCNRGYIIKNALCQYVRYTHVYRNIGRFNNRVLNQACRNVLLSKCQVVPETSHGRISVAKTSCH